MGKKTLSDGVTMDADDTSETTRLHTFHTDHNESGYTPSIKPSRSPGFKRRIMRITASIAAHALLLLALVALFWLLSQQDVPNRTHLLIACGGVAVVLYLIILIEANFSHTLTSLRTFSSTTTIADYVGSVLGARPEITWYAQGFHYAKNAKSDKVYITDMETGGPSSGKKTVTREERRDFKFSSWREVGRDIRDFVPDGVIRLECSKLFIFKDEDSKSNYMQQYANFREQYGHIDRFVTHKEVFHVEGFQERITGGLHTTHRPCLLREPLYWLFTAVLLTWLYRALYRMMTTKVYMITIKEIAS